MVSPGRGPAAPIPLCFFLAAPARATSSFFLVRRLFSFVCAPSRFLIAAAAARVGRDQASHQHRPGRLAQPEPAAQLVQRRDIIGIMRDTGSNRARERAPRGRGRGRADRSPRCLRSRRRGRRQSQRRASKLIVFTSTCKLQKRPLRTADVSIPSVSRERRRTLPKG